MPSSEGPDQGHAWVIAFSACTINMILAGISRMVGMLYVVIIDVYGVSRGDATLPFTVRNTARCVAGPLVGIVGQKYGIRFATICGGVMAALGVALCSIAPSILWLTIFWGGLYGVGFAFANTLFQVVVNQYFDKHRTTASGIALSGACIGSFIFPFAMEYFLEEFGLHGTFLILGGVIMNVLPPALLLRTPPWLDTPGKQHGPPKEITAKLCEEHNDTCINLPSSTSMSNSPAEEISVLNVRMSISSETRVIQQLILPNDCVTGLNSMNRNSLCDIYNKERERIVNTAECQESQRDADSCWEILKSMGRLFLNPIYILINICMAVYIVIFIPVLTVLMDYSEDKGFPKEMGKYFIHCLAIGDLIGRLCFGWITDRTIISTSRFMTVTLGFQGTFVALFPHATAVYSFMILLALYGMTAGCLLVQFPVLVYKYLTIEEQPVAMGCVGFFSGLISLAIPPLIGYFRDNIGSYDGMFYISGGISLITGLIWIAEQQLVKWSR